jgi:pimeloyl-ACP methyl ester carboxylesterase
MRAHTVVGGGGLELHVEETGNPRGKPILFIHGLTVCGSVWKRQLDSELGSDFRLVAMDLRGHGASAKPRDVYGDPKLWADDIRAVMDTLELDDPVLSGWSYGGIVISDYVSCYGEDAIAATNWVGAVSRLGEPLVAAGFLHEAFIALVPGFFSENIAEGAAALQQLIRFCAHAELPLEEWYSFVGYMHSVPPYVRQGLLSRNVDNDAVIARMRTPMLVSCGAEDEIVTPAMRDRLMELRPDAKLSVYPGVGHAPFWEAYERFNHELREFRESV